jgi:hypothetical protein
LNENAGLDCADSPGAEEGVVPAGFPKTTSPDFDVSGTAVGGDGCPKMFLGGSEPPPKMFFDGIDEAWLLNMFFDASEEAAPKIFFVVADVACPNTFLVGSEVFPSSGVG